MCAYVLAVLYGLFVWWFSTGAVLAVVRLSGRAPLALRAGAVVLLAGAFAALAATRNDAGQAGAYLAFTAAILAWGAQEIAFLTGWITGPWRRPCPAGAGPWSRAGYAVSAILYHELALLASGAAVVWATWGGANPVGPWTFGVLLAMRVSAKLNVFLGVPNITESFLPAEIAHLKSFFTRRRMNALFPVSVTASTVALVVICQSAIAAEPDGAVALTLVATLVALGLLEHWFFVLPLPVEALWSWGLVDAGESRPAPSGETAPLAAAMAGGAGPGRNGRYRSPSHGHVTHAAPGARVTFQRSE